MTAGHLHRDHAVAEPLGRPPVLRGSRDWGARRRATARQTERYSRFVTIMKRALPLAAAALVAAVLIYALQPRQERGAHVAMTFQRLGIVNDDLAMLKPRLTGTDDQGDPYVVTADEAIQDKTNSKRATLRNVQGDVTLKDGTWISATAPRGLLDAKTGHLMLVGPIAVYSDSGYEMHTTEAFVDMRTGTIVGSRAVSGQGQFGVFRADRFRLNRHQIAAAGNSALPRDRRGHHERVQESGAGEVFLYGNVRMSIDARKMHS
ncbi:MAG TPA: LPS export ABC transporter periplasmic protein LptC [Rhizomicrobium sp.]|nr:LPS export ABC transporter periplasmic protein LptC [Rhizomicrobium sp.]